MASRRPRLFDALPQLADRIPWIDLGLVRSPVHRLVALGSELGHAGLWIKRDDLDSAVYGGNKGRKLAFLLGEAVAQRASSVISVGTTGSNQCVATAAFARELGLHAIAGLAPQPVLPIVRRNLLLDLYFGSEFMVAPDYTRLGELVLERLRADPKARLIAPGGSTPPGNLGFVDAGLELAEQVAHGELPEPDRIFIAGGSTGSAAGLQVGLRLAGLRSRVHAVKVSADEWCTREILAEQVRGICTLLGDERLAGTPPPDFDTSAFGDDYGIPTAEALDALRRMRALERIALDPCYTAKAFAALVRYVDGASPDETVLFWHTANGRDLSAEIGAHDYHDLPAELHPVFDEPLPDLGLDPALIEALC